MNIATLFTALFLGLFGHSDDPFDRTTSGQMNLQIETSTALEGNVRVLLFNRFDDPYLPEEAAFMTISKTGDEANAPIIYNSIPYGDYIVLSYIDVNGNGKLDRTFLGAPREPWGISSTNGDLIGSAQYSTNAIISFSEHNQSVSVNIHEPLVRKSKQVKGSSSSNATTSPTLLSNK